MIPIKPNDVTWNDEQWRAIYESGHDLLISAGAGSGKTAVLVERIIQKMMTQHVSVDELLVLTFTNAAAAEMKHRIRSRLEKEVNQTPNEQLSKQLNKISSANISTFHGFCNKLLHRYYFLVDLDPTFKIADDIELGMIEDDVMDALFLEAAKEEDEHYLRLEKAYNGDRLDVNLKQLLLKVYRVARANPYMIEWLHELDELYLWDNHDLSTWRFYEVLKIEAINVLTKAKQLFEQAHDVAISSELSDTPHPYREIFKNDVKWVSDLLQALDMSYHDVKVMSDQLKLLTYKSPTAKVKEHFDLEMASEAKALRDKAKKQLEVVKTFFLYKNETHKQHFDESILLIKSFEQLLLAFHHRFEGAKRERQLVDFSDLEWYTIRLLQQNGQLTDIAKEVGESLHEIMVDEYQDTNQMQEYIIKAIATSVTPNIPIFMVGDVKQSIYRFRLAEPGIFQHKYKSFQLEDESGQKIDLMRNYRSHKSVLDSTNFVFKQIMDEEVGDIEYDESAMLRLGVKNEPDDEMVVSEVHLIDRETFEEDDYSVIELEAIHLAKLIKSYVKNKAQIYDRGLGAHRDVMYRDVVILMRSLSHVSVYQDVFRRFDIPLFAEVTTDLFDSIEIINILSALRVVDNPYQDIPLIGLMRSPLFFFSDSELARIKTFKKSTYFIEVLREFGELATDETLRDKVNHFLEFVTRWRSRAKHLSLSRLIRTIYEETMYYDFVVGLPHGDLRKANLDLFYEKAKSFEQISQKKVFGFIRYIERMQSLGKHFPKAKTVTAHDDVVRIMSIHKSKGLEFPIVIVSQIHRQFNKQDESGDVLLHKEYGLAMKYINPTLRLKQETVAQKVVAKKMHQEMLAEEMRLLYVAMTRAKSKLIFSGVYKVTKKLESFESVQSHKELLLPTSIRQQAKAYGDWLLPCLLRQGDIAKCVEINSNPFIIEDESRWTLNVITSHEEEEIMDEALVNVDVKIPNKTISFDKTYAYQPLTQVKAKQTVSERKVDETTPLLAGVIVKKQEVAYDRPSFMKDINLSHTEIGTAYHNFMQHFNFETDVSWQSLNALRDELVAKEVLDANVASKLDLNVILSFTTSPLYDYIKKSTVKKAELPFMMLVNDLNVATAEVLLQGVIDLLVEHEDEILIVDYKSDYVKDFEKQREELTNRYRVQMRYYIEAITKIYPNKTVSCAVHYLRVNETIYYKPTELL